MAGGGFFTGCCTNLSSNYQPVLKGVVKMEQMNLFGDCQESLEVLYKHVPKKIFCSLVEKIFPNVARYERMFHQTMSVSDITLELGVALEKARYLRKRDLKLSSLNDEKPWREDLFSESYLPHRKDFDDADLTDEEFEVMDHLDGTAQIYLPRCCRTIVNGTQFISKEQEDEYKMIKVDGMRLKGVKQQTYGMCLAAVKQNPFALQYVERPLPEYYKAAMEGLEKSKFNVCKA